MNSFSLQWVKPSFLLTILTFVLLNPDIPRLCKQSRSRSVGFWRSQLIWICTVWHWISEFISTTWIKLFDWLKIGSGCGILIYSAWQGLRWFLCCSSLFVCRWFHMWCLFCYCLFLISPYLGPSGKLCFVIVAFPGYTQLFSIHCRLNELPHTIYLKILISSLGMSGYVI